MEWGLVKYGKNFLEVGAWRIQVMRIVKMTLHAFLACTKIVWEVTKLAMPDSKAIAEFYLESTFCKPMFSQADEWMKTAMGALVLQLAKQTAAEDFLRYFDVTNKEWVLNSSWLHIPQRFCQYRYDWPLFIR